MTTLRKYRNNTMTTSPLLNAVVKMNDAKTDLSINPGSLSLPLLKINIVDVLSDLTTQFECSQEELKEKSISILPGSFVNEVKQMLERVYPSCSCECNEVCLKLYFVIYRREFSY